MLQTINEIINLPLEDAQKLLDRHRPKRIPYRVVLSPERVVDPNDYVANRVNIYTEDGIVKSFYLG